MLFCVVKMNDYLIKQYVSNLTHKDINIFAEANGITLNNNETNLIYDNIKNNWRTIVYGNPRGILNDLKTKLEPNTYDKIENLYVSFKDKFQNYL